MVLVTARVVELEKLLGGEEEELIAVSIIKLEPHASIGEAEVSLLLKFELAVDPLIDRYLSNLRSILNKSPPKHNPNFLVVNGARQVKNFDIFLFGLDRPFLQNFKLFVAMDDDVFLFGKYVLIK